jgi:hypothetical protein
MSRRQSERASRFQAEIEESVRSAAVAFRDDDVEASVRTAVRLWWTSHLRGRRFAQLVRQAYEVTQARISWRYQRGDARQREAMPYFLAVLRDLVANDVRTRQPGTLKSGIAASVGGQPFAVGWTISGKPEGAPPWSCDEIGDGRARRSVGKGRLGQHVCKIAGTPGSVARRDSVCRTLCTRRWWPAALVASEAQGVGVAGDAVAKQIGGTPQYRSVVDQPDGTPCCTRHTGSSRHRYATASFGPRRWVR